MRMKEELRQKRRAHIRKHVSGTTSRPRLCVFRSNRYIYAQIIDDVQGITLASANDKKSKAKTPVAKAHEVGEQIATLAKKAKITDIVFDRSGYMYHGRVKSLAEGARAGGLKF
jgi:large subunit ribosomal protein L18